MPQNSLARLIPFYLIIFIDNLSVSLVLPVLIPISYDPSAGLIAVGGSGTRDVFYGLAIGLYSLAMFFGAPLLGSLSDLFQRKRTLALCLSGLFVGYALTVWAMLSKDVVLFLAGRVVCGLFSGSLPVAQAAIIDVTPKEHRVTAIGRIMFWVSMGYVAGPLIGGYLSDATLVSWFTLQTPFVFVAGATLLNLVILLVTYREQRVAKPADGFSLPNPVARLVEAFRFPGIRVLSVALLLMSLGWTAFFQFIGLYLTANEGFDQRTVGNLISVVGVGLAAAFLVFVPLTAKWARPMAVVPAALLIMTACIVATTLTGAVAVLYPVGLLGAIGYGLAYSGLVGLMSVAVDDSHQGSIMGMAGAIAASSAGVTGVVFGLIDGAGLLPILSAAVLVLLAAVLMGVRSTAVEPAANAGVDGNG
ncbi:MFS transporter [Umezawaea sp. NPDC059074]|uniref:MFS transporter n=1 Tax=Umezawaea sp. NPDC059074 TaxID=3346716 RepID=UPI0036CB2372